MATRTFTDSHIFIIVDINNREEEEKFSLGTIIGIIVASIVVLAIIIGIILFIRRKKDISESSENQELNEEVFRSTDKTMSITTENPLWSASFNGISDDPFKNDFEEGINYFLHEIIGVPNQNQTMKDNSDISMMMLEQSESGNVLYDE
ncbi:hypothetical protein TRFO_13787 [Tritrichomonas foetus]|uniref:Uncharacterized protein n=1 Tax=Tritrichomonas foetus TaxID=1144522 RepID=A0A1J4L1M2_9EUKA|nr:hypothetical protein TRFO_13787 [Tritrichomonas foetus]|eukprot:OHT15789.1 hypothetical protein TRFO_13787 [Tritrichomonas foetus]